jgi:hypothetical protein
MRIVRLLEGWGLGAALAHGGSARRSRLQVRWLFAVVLPEWRKGGTGGVEKRGTDCPCHEEIY